ncbi:MAG: 3-methyl-2-oxobutanoate hydroxymethyltransferase [Actinomycetaceae bacterium]|nr:3-methyl-2-oxobutanoate hydroxymethyltransferase [Actinomycetaceae bacterium]
MNDSSAVSSAGDFKEPKTWRVQHLAQSKAAGRKLTMLTAYDALTAAILDKAGVDILLVGDSYGNVMLGFGSTLPVSLADMVRATAAVASVAKRPLVVADLPFGSYESSPAKAFDSVAQLMKAGANMVKLEGAGPRLEAVRLLTSSGIPVCAHLGFTPQSENSLGGPRMQGRGEGRERLLADALALQGAGASLLVLEMVPADVAREVTEQLTIPTIGIGAGPDTSGQVLVWSDMAGMTEWTPRFVRRFAELGQALQEAASEYCDAVRDGSFPALENYHER